MEKIIRFFSVLLCTVFLACCITGCADAGKAYEQKEGSIIEIVLPGKTERKISQSKENISFYDIYIYGAGEEVVDSAKELQPGAIYKSKALEEGLYQIRVDACNDEKTVIGCGSEEATVVAKETATVNIIIELYEITRNISVAVKGDDTVKTVKWSISNNKGYKKTGTSDTLSFNILDTNPAEYTINVSAYDGNGILIAKGSAITTVTDEADGTVEVTLSALSNNAIEDLKPIIPPYSIVCKEMEGRVTMPFDNHEWLFEAVPDDKSGWNFNEDTRFIWQLNGYELDDHGVKCKFNPFTTSVYMNLDPEKVNVLSCIAVKDGAFVTSNANYEILITEKYTVSFEKTADASFANETIVSKDYSAYADDSKNTKISLADYIDCYKSANNEGNIPNSYIITGWKNVDTDKMYEPEEELIVNDVIRLVPVYKAINDVIYDSPDGSVITLYDNNIRLGKIDINKSLTIKAGANREVTLKCSNTGIEASYPWFNVSITSTGENACLILNTGDEDCGSLTLEGIDSGGSIIYNTGYCEVNDRVYLKNNTSSNDRYGGAVTNYGELLFNGGTISGCYHFLSQDYRLGSIANYGSISIGGNFTIEGESYNDSSTYYSIYLGYTDVNETKITSLNLSSELTTSEQIEVLLPDDMYTESAKGTKIITAENNEWIASAIRNNKIKLFIPSVIGMLEYGYIITEDGYLSVSTNN